jgi:hypothetical protein
MFAAKVVPEVRRHDTCGLIGSYKNLVVSFHWGTTTLSHADDLKTYIAEVLQRYPRFLSAVLVSGPGLPEAPDAKTRDSLRQLIEQTEDTGIGTAFIVTSRGFLASAAVALVSGLFVLSRSREPHRAFRDVETAGDWLAGCSDTGTTPWDPGELQAALQALVALDPRARSAA